VDGDDRVAGVVLAAEQARLLELFQALLDRDQLRAELGALGNAPVPICAVLVARKMSGASPLPACRKLMAMRPSFSVRICEGTLKPVTS